MAYKRTTPAEHPLAPCSSISPARFDHTCAVHELHCSCMYFAVRCRVGFGLGVQYASGRYRALNAEHGMTASMSRTGSSSDNAMVGSFRVKLQAEMAHHEHFATKAESATAVFEYVEMFCTRNHLDALLQYLSPEQAEGRSVG
jgi:hypothetical protein